MSQRGRRRAILEIVRDRPIRSQAELVTALRRRGHEATQATVSRDIRRLGLVKQPVAGSSSRYVPPEQLAPADENGEPGDLREACAQFVIEVGDVEGLLLLRTRAGRANAVAVAIDECRLPEVAGTLAGDDTILILLRRRGDRARLKIKLASFLE